MQSQVSAVEILVRDVDADSIDTSNDTFEDVVIHIRDDTPVRCWVMTARSV